MSFADYIAADRDKTAAYKRMDVALEKSVLDARVWRQVWDFIFLGYCMPHPIPARFSITAENGDRWDINISARATLIERGKPQEE